MAFVKDIQFSFFFNLSFFPLLKLTISFQSAFVFFFYKRFQLCDKYLFINISCAGRISAIGLLCADLAALDPQCQDLRLISHGPRTWLLRFTYGPRSVCSKLEDSVR